MRIRKLVAAAAAMVMGAGQAEAVTIVTQPFSASYQRYGSTGSQSLYSLPLVNQTLLSATIDWTYAQIIRSTFAIGATLSYSGRIGFSVDSNLPEAINASTAYSGSVLCTESPCSATIERSGTYDIPVADLPLFFNSSQYLQIGLNRDFQVNASLNNMGPTPEVGEYVYGAIVYRLTDPVPEPATWAMTILGLGLAGAAVRRQRRRAALFPA